MRVVLVLVLALGLVGCAGGDGPVVSDQCRLPVEERTGGWFCDGEPSPASR